MNDGRDPIRASQRDMRPVLPRRFYAKANFEPRDGGYALLLDGRPARTPGKNPLRLRTAPLAEALASEWARQGEFIDPRVMPLTRLANSALDGVATRMADVADEISGYAGSDLVCYRADGPDELVRAQGDAWDPVLDWAHEALGARFILSQGVKHVAQPESSLNAVRARVAAIGDPLTLAGLSVATTLTGSALLALALHAGRFSAAEAWAAAHVDEDFQIMRWGQDAEAALRRQARWCEIEAAALALGA